VSSGSPIDKLQQLLTRCKCGVYLQVNQHRDYYQAAEDALRECSDHDQPGFDEVPADVLAEMIKRDQIVELQFYPDTPGGFHKVWHYDLDGALGAALSCLQARRG
jgi:hypothetical protein